jgi:anti-sigma-K factor RskA
MNAAPMSHEEALDLAGLYALDALTPDEKALVDAHLAVCSQDHAEFAALGGVAPALATLAEPMGAPAALKRRVLEAYAHEQGRPAVPLRLDAPSAVTTTLPAARNVARRPASGRLGWAAAALAVVLVAVVGVYGLNARQQADAANARAAEIARAVAALSQPGAQIAYLRGSGPAATVSGFVAVPPGSPGYMVLTDVPAAPAGKTYQAWFIAGGKPTSAGTMAPGADGSVIADGMQPVPGTAVIAVTIEPSGGSVQPTSDPIIVGNVGSVSTPG